MNIKIKFKNSKYCNGCPCLFLYKCSYNNNWKVKSVLIVYEKRWEHTRPQKCIDKNGE